ncbi:MAG: hypothetical protein RL094_282 [Candidatus Parcubacteria bacterium]|jgi:FAD/FMN-containing dehydrogenase
MSTLREKLQSVIKGEVKDDKATLVQYSRDASVVEIVPKVVVYPKDSADIQALVKWVAANKAEDTELSLTPRSAGTDMSGGPLNESIIIDINKYMQGTLEVGESQATVLPGTFYRDFEKETMAKGLFFPSYPASKNICTVGGIVANNSAGEKTLTYGQTKQYVRKLKVVFADGNEYTVQPLSYDELVLKIAQHDFEGSIYAKVWKLISDNAAEITAAKPKTAKNSAGYFLWDVWNPETKIFDLTKLIVGSQGTLGIVTEITFDLVPVQKYSKMLTVFLPTLDHIGPLVNEILSYKPASLESYDEDTIRLAIKYFPDLLHRGHLKDLIQLCWNFIPEFWMGLTGGFPKLMLLIQFDGNDQEELLAKVRNLQKHLQLQHIRTRVVGGESESKKYWTIRRESYNLLRAHGAGKKVATFIEDVIVPPEHLPEFLPKLREILRSYNLTYSIAGHAGNGNFHIFPLMDFKDPEHASRVLEISQKVYNLVAEFHGSITAEHSDGIVRTPYLATMYNEKVLQLFADVKRIFDEKTILNPNKKVGTTVDYFKKHIITS